jgi:hypothetical protein
MKYKALFLLSFGASVLCHATTALPYAGECSVLDQIAATVVARPDTDAVALTLMEKVALGRSADITPESEVQVGVVAGQLRQKGFDSSAARMCAFHDLGRVGLPEAEEFLAKLRPADMGADATGQVWPAAQEALANARLARVTDPQLRIEFLERIVTDRAPAAYWAVEQLCNGGDLASRAIIQESIRSRLNGQRDEDEIRFCETRMHVVSRYPDRVKALGSVLSVDNPEDEDRLVRWAIYQLAEMHSPDATAELERFAKEVGKLPNSSPQRVRWNGFKQELEILKERHDVGKGSAN